MPFAGREAIYARLQQHILDPPTRHALLFTGHDAFGKSALLKHFNSVFGDLLLGVFFPLHDLELTDEALWLRHIVDATNTLLDDHQYSLSRLPTIHQESAAANLSLRTWLHDVYLPDVMAVIRPHRRLVWLFDDAHLLLNNLPADHITYLHNLLSTHRQLSIILTLNTRYENRIPDLAPLADVANAERIPRLDEAACAGLMRQFAPATTDRMARLVYEQTGGHPLLLQRYGEALARIWATSSAIEAIEKATPVVYKQSRVTFRQQWEQLNRDEQIVLKAICDLFDVRTSTEAVTVPLIENWLIETDYPMDVIAINAALRGLDYQDMVMKHPQGIVVTSRLLQQWLQNHAQIDEAPESTGEKLQLRWWIIAGIIFAIVVLMLLLTLLFNLPVDTNPLIPTVTLSS